MIQIDETKLDLDTTYTVMVKSKVDEEKKKGLQWNMEWLEQRSEMGNSTQGWILATALYLHWYLIYILT